MIFGHFTTSYVMFSFLRPNYTSRELMGGVLCAYLPDIIDKSLYFLALVPYSRSIGHNIMIPLSLAALSYSFKKKSSFKRIFEIISLGFIFHQFQDCMDPAMWFWPLLGPYPIEEQRNYTLGQSLYQYYTFQRKSLEIWIELIGHGAFVCQMIRLLSVYRIKHQKISSMEK